METISNDLGRRMWQHKWMYLFLLPALVWFTIFMYGPIYGLQIAFKDFNISRGVLGSPWVGFKHFFRMFSDNLFWRSFRNTFTISILKLIFVAPSGLVLALMLNEIAFRPFRNAVQDISLLPHFFSWVVIASIMIEILSPSTGLVNKFIVSMGGKPIFFLAERNWFYCWIVLSDVWESAGWNSIIFIAAIAGISPELYESASIDGAGRLRKVFAITIPCIAPTVVVVMIIKVGGIMNAGFNQVFNLYNNAVIDSADILETYVYRLGIGNMRFSYAAAVGFFQNVLALLFVILTDRFAKKIGQDGLW
jgi:putative aldouronate transport system permease protein